MADTTLAAIQRKFRQITATPSPEQLTDAEVNEYVNTFYLYDFPAELQLLKLKSNYVFFLQPNVDEYEAPIERFTTFSQPLYIGGFDTKIYQDQQLFYAEFPKIEFRKTVGTGDGLATAPILTALSPVPVYPSSVYLTTTVGGSVVSYNDNGLGQFVDSNGVIIAGSSVNYTTGALTLDWGTPPDSGAAIEAIGVFYTAARPWGMLYYDSKFKFRPAPDKSYKVEIQGFLRPTEFLNTAQSPELNQWWQLLAIGAAMKFFEDNDDLESIARYRPLYDEQVTLVNRRTIIQNSQKSILTPFSREGGSYGWGFFGDFYGN